MAGFADRNGPVFLVILSPFVCLYFCTKLLFAITPSFSRFALPSEPPPPEEFARSELDVTAMFEVALNKLRARQPEEAAALVQEGLALIPGVLVGRLLLGIARLMQDQAKEARELLAGVFADPALHPSWRNELLNNIAWADFLLGDEARKDEADRYSAEAAAAVPGDAALQGTRGSVLVWIGRLEEGISLLSDSFHATEWPRGRSFNACAIAIGEARRGRFDVAEAWIERARAENPECILLSRAEEAISEANRPDGP